MGYLKIKSAVLIHERHANLVYEYGNNPFWARGYYVRTIGINQKTIQKYIREQESEDRLKDKMTKREYLDLLKDKVNKYRKNKK